MAEVGERSESDAGPARFDPRQAAIVSYGFTTVLAIVIVVSAVGVWNVGTTTTYPLRQAIEWDWRARATNNLVDMAMYLNRSIELLLAYHGNPAWIFPTPDTDLDQIRTNLVESRDTALAVAASETIGSFGYQQAVQNLQETIVEINEHLALAKGWYVRSQAGVELFVGYLVLTVLTPLIAVGVRTVDKSRGNRALGLFAAVWLAGTIAVGSLLAIIP